MILTAASRSENSAPMCEQLSKAFVMLTVLWVIFSRWACYLFFYCFSVLFWILHIAELSVALGKYFRTDGAENLHKHQNVKLNISRLETSFKPAQRLALRLPASIVLMAMGEVSITPLLATPQLHPDSPS